MAFDKITDAERQGKGNVGLPDTPALTTAEMQAQMDSLANLMIDKYNEFIDKLTGDDAATYIGALVPPEATANPNIQSILNSMVTKLGLCVAVKHSHPNKEVLDSISQEAFDGLERVLMLLAGIMSIEQRLTDNSSALPSSAAVKYFVDNYDFRSVILRFAYPVGSVYSTTGRTNPTTYFGGTWNLIDTDSAGVSRFKRVG